MLSGRGVDGLESVTDRRKVIAALALEREGNALNYGCSLIHW